jgi:curli biogenesis system outer membrane secretion channel CsgG
MNAFLNLKVENPSRLFITIIFCGFCIFNLQGCASSMQGKDVANRQSSDSTLRRVPILRMAVVGFDVAASNYGLKMLDRKAEDMLTTALIKTRQFNMIDRKHIRQVIDEQKFQISGMVDTVTAVKIGKILGAQVIVTGSITEMGCRAASFIAKVTTCRASIDLQVINVETAEIIAAETGSGTSSAVIHYDAEKALAQKDSELWVSEALRSASEEAASKIAKMGVR